MMNIDSSSSRNPHSSTISASCPFYLHANENPSLILVQPTLSGSNYHSWSRAMRMTLKSKNKITFVDGSLAVPASSDPLFPAWKQCNSMVLSWILNSVSSSISPSIMWHDTPYDVWIDLSERFSHGDTFRLSDILEELNSVKQGESNVTDYYTKLKILWEELLVLRPIPKCVCNPSCSCGAAKLFKEYFEAECIVRFLKGLNDNFNSVKSQVLCMSQLPAMNKVFGMVIKCERQMNYSLGHPSTPEVSIFAVNNSGYERRYSASQSNRFTGEARSSNKSYQLGDKVFQCTYCGMSGHTEDRCYRKHGFPTNSRGRGRSSYSRGRGASAIQISGYNDADESVPEQTPTTGFTQEQVNQLMSFLQNKMTVNEPENAGHQTTVLSASFEKPNDALDKYTSMAVN